MTPKNKETAEQKLLKMIEASSGTAPKNKQVSKKHNLLSVVKFFNRALLIGLIMAFLLLGYEVRSGLALKNKSSNFTSSTLR